MTNPIKITAAALGVSGIAAAALVYGAAAIKYAVAGYGTASLTMAAYHLPLNHLLTALG